MTKCPYCVFWQGKNMIRLHFIA